MSARGSLANYILDGYKIVDLTHTLKEGIPQFLGDKPFSYKRVVDYHQGYRVYNINTADGVGTHLDAPSHFIKGAKDLTQIDLEDFIAPITLIDIKKQVAIDPNYQVSIKDIEDNERLYGKIDKGSVVLVNSGWSERFSNPISFINDMNFAGFSPDSAEFFIDRGIKGVGIDTLSLDCGTSKTFDFHKNILKANIYGLENVANLDLIPPRGATLIVGALKIEEGSHITVRLLSFVKK